MVLISKLPSMPFIPTMRLHSYFPLLKCKKLRGLFPKSILTFTIITSFTGLYLLFQMIKNLDVSTCYNKIKNALAIPLEMMGGNGFNRRFKNREPMPKKEKKELWLKNFKWNGLGFTRIGNNWDSSDEESEDEMPTRPYKPLVPAYPPPEPTIVDRIVTVSVKEKGFEFTEQFLRKRLPNEKVYNFEISSLETTTFEIRRALLRRFKDVKMENEQISKDFKVNFELGAFKNIYVNELGERYELSNSVGFLQMLDVATSGFRGHKINIKRCDVDKIRGRFKIGDEPVNQKGRVGCLRKVST